MTRTYWTVAAPPVSARNRRNKPANNLAAGSIATTSGAVPRATPYAPGDQRPETVGHPVGLPHGDRLVPRLVCRWKAKHRRPAGHHARDQEWGIQMSYESASARSE